MRSRRTSSDPYQSVLGQSGRFWKINPDNYMAYKFDPITRRRTYQQMDPTEIYRDLQSGHFTFDAPAYDNRLSISAAMYDTPDMLRAFQDRQQEYVDELIDIVPENIMEEYRVGSGPDSYLNVPELMRNYDTLSTTYPAVPSSWEDYVDAYPNKQSLIPFYIARDYLGVDFNDADSLDDFMRKLSTTTYSNGYSYPSNRTPAQTFEHLAEQEDTIHDRQKVWDVANRLGIFGDDAVSPYLQDLDDSLPQTWEEPPNRRETSVTPVTPVTPEDVTLYDQAYVNQAVADALAEAPQRRTDEELSRWATDQGLVDPSTIVDETPFDQSDIDAALVGMQQVGEDEMVVGSDYVPEGYQDPGYRDDWLRPGTTAYDLIDATQQIVPVDFRSDYLSPTEAAAEAEAAANEAVSDVISGAVGLGQYDVATGDWIPFSETQTTNINELLGDDQVVVNTDYLDGYVSKTDADLATEIARQEGIESQVGYTTAAPTNVSTNYAFSLSAPRQTQAVAPVYGQTMTGLSTAPSYSMGGIESLVGANPFLQRKRVLS